MKIKINPLLITAHSISFLIDDDGLYYTQNQYDIYIDGDKVMSTKTAVNSIFNLESDTSYELILRNESGEDVCRHAFETEYEFMTINVKDMGAVGDGVHDDTEFIQAAILAAPSKSRVLVPEGKYLVKSLFLKSDVNIEIAKNAVLLADTTKETRVRFPGSIKTSNPDDDEYHLGTWEGNPEPMFAGIINGINVENVVLYGQGIVDGQSSVDNWWNNPKVMNIAYRPRMLFLNKCCNVNVQGVMLTNSPSWTVHPFFSKNLKFIDMCIKNPQDSPNTDGIDPESCQNVEIAGVKFSLGDDCIAVKSGKFYMGQKYKSPSDNIFIHHCLMENGHGAVTLGSEIAGGVTNVLVENCLFKDTDRGLRIKTRRGRGRNCFLDNIMFRNINMNGVLSPFTANMFYFCDPDGHSPYVQSRDELPVDERTPKLGKLVFENIRAVDAHVCAAYFLGLPEEKIDSVEMKDVFVSFAEDAKEGVPIMSDGIWPMKKRGIVARNVGSLVIKNVKIIGYEGDKLTLSQVDDVEEEN